MTKEPSLHVRLRLTHGVLQRIADKAGADVLHVKGPAVARELLDTRDIHDAEGSFERTETIHRNSSDADLLIRPEHVHRFLDEASRHGWIRKTSFSTSSAFGHAMNIFHPTLGNADVHRRFPGLAPEAFDELWRARTSTDLGHVPCPTPSVTAQRLLLLLHSARSGPHHPDTGRAWDRASVDERAGVLALARHLGAEIGVAAAVGDLEAFRDHPEYLLWKHFRDGNPSRLDEWRARWRAATTVGKKAAVVQGLLFFDPSLLEAELGHAPSHREVAQRTLLRWRRLIGELAARRTSTGGRA
ncbi:2-nitropropane dioxygenase [Tessaracoccus sp. MC1679]|uniref:2-nitropropane dioxygenase n=1 Tax=Tessaracoccus sp. MC1679 TaxID=2760313 RepID=UPI0016003E2E|nr:2-nitropropane dioxygenase [Tessaracoccus sp. MC1679]MBB1517134.1 2-nitropropane dioxygenase [Tessaracoccus sp. MC1679]